MRVPYSYLDRQFADIDDYLTDIREFVKTGDFTLGRKMEEFEKKFAGLIGTKYAVGVNSGTDALILSLKALGIGPGDEVITCVETFIATVGAIVATGARPIFVDSNDEFTMNVSQIEQVITPKTKAIIPVWFTGNAPSMNEILAIAKKYNLFVVEDSCCGIGADIKSKKAGSFGNTGTFSFHPLKNLNVWSDGGMITTNSDELARYLRLYRNHGLANRDEVEFFGINSRLDTLQAIIGLRLFRDVKKITDTRIANAKTVDEGLCDIPEIVIPRRNPDVRQVFHLYMLIVQRRDELLRFLNENGIEAKVHYPIPLHLQKAASYLGYKEGDFPVCEKHSKEIVTLPVHQHLTAQEIDYMINMVRNFYGK